MRKELVLVIPAAEGNRDSGKQFVIREMSARRAEKWAMRALMAAMRGGVQLPSGVAIDPTLGMQGIVVSGLMSMAGGSLVFDEIEPLLDEMMECVHIRPEPRNPMVERPLIDDDVEEVGTLLLLRQEVLQLHMGFLKAGSQSKSTSEKPASGTSSNTSTSPAPSGTL